MNTTFSSDELEILEYLKSWDGRYVTLIDISRCAGGRQRFRDSPNWANGLMARLIEAKVVNVNERGHYCYVVPPKPAEPKPAAPKTAAPAAPKNQKSGVIVGDDYFPAPEPADPAAPRWVSPQIEAILKQSKKFTK